eukprot:3154518-Amphidinium_carterae.1
MCKGAIGFYRVACEGKGRCCAEEALEAKRDLSRTHCVVDMDMFYAAVEIRDNPELEHKPVAIGGLGMISTSNYVARLYGVRAAMPGFIAQEMVREPHLVGSKMPPDELIFVRLPLVESRTYQALDRQGRHESEIWGGA